jgi:hypothetical protein
LKPAVPLLLMLLATGCSAARPALEPGTGGGGLLSEPEEPDDWDEPLTRALPFTSGRAGGRCEPKQELRCGHASDGPELLVCRRRRWVPLRRHCDAALSAECGSDGFASCLIPPGS